MTRVVLIDDQTVVRQGVASLFRQAGIEVVGEGSSGEDAIRLAQSLRPEAVVLDVTLEGLNGIEACRRISKGGDGAPAVIVLSMHTDSQLAERALAAGARGFVGKRGDFSELLRAVRSALRGETFVSSLSQRDGAPGSAHPNLTDREHEVLQLVAEGLTSKEIAAQLGLSPKTVVNHRANIMQKLNISSTVGLVRYVLTHGR